MKYIYTLLFITGLVFTWSIIHPKDSFTWFMEVFPAIIGLVILSFTFKKFRFTNLVYTLIAIHCCILFVGGHYTYAEVPLFDWIRDLFHQQRNNYDKVGHFAQGFIPVVITRELMLRKNVLSKKSWLNFIAVCICMAISATYEFIEWLVSGLTGESADAFLGTQGYVWDTQSDMLYATIGAIVALTVLSRVHDKQLRLTSYE